MLFSWKLEQHIAGAKLAGLHMKSMSLPCWHFYFILPGQGIAYTYCGKLKRPWENLEAEIPKGRAKGSSFWASEPDLSHPTNVLRLACFCWCLVVWASGTWAASVLQRSQKPTPLCSSAPQKDSASQKKKSGNQEGKRQEFKGWRPGRVQDACSSFLSNLFKKLELLIKGLPML